MRKHIKFGELMLSQIHNGVVNPLDNSDICLPNLIHRILAHQKEAGHMIGDDKLMGEPKCLSECVFI